MIGVFDSGVGGMNAVKRIKELCPREDVIYLADRKNAPYGTKCESELSSLVRRDVERLLLLGAERILIACCTASTVYPSLPKRLSSVSTPIIGFAASRAAALSRTGKIGVIATEHTVRSRAFSKALSEINGSLSVYEHATQPLVGLVESGVRDGSIGYYERETLRELLGPLKRENTDVLILGCTHFSSLAREISDAMGDGVEIIDAARIGAEEFIKSVCHSGRGRLCYTT